MLQKIYEKPKVSIQIIKNAKPSIQIIKNAKKETGTNERTLIL